MSEIDWANLTEQDLEKIEKHLPTIAKEIKEGGGIEKWNQKRKEKRLEAIKQSDKFDKEKNWADWKKKWEESDEGKKWLKAKKYRKKEYARIFQKILDNEAKYKSG